MLSFLWQRKLEMLLKEGILLILYSYLYCYLFNYINLSYFSFYRKCKLPEVIGCIDGTHVAIIRPNQHEEQLSFSICNDCMYLWVSFLDSVYVLNNIKYNLIHMFFRFVMLILILSVLPKPISSILVQGNWQPNRGPLRVLLFSRLL